MMDCQRVESLLADYLGGELSTPEQAAVDDHLAECKRCSADVRSLTATLDALGQLDAGSFERSAAVIPMRRGTWRQGLAYAAVLMIGCMVGWVMKPADPAALPTGGSTTQTDVERGGGRSFDGASFVDAKGRPDSFRRNAYLLFKAFRGGS